MASPRKNAAVIEIAKIRTALCLRQYSAAISGLAINSGFGGVCAAFD
jgi:hypothetical protein